MLKDLLRTLRQLPDRRFLKVLGVSLLLAALLYVGLVAAVAWALTSFSLFELTWLDRLVDVLGWIAFAWIAILLFPSFAMAIQGLLLEDVAQAVESRYYPDLPEPRPQSWGELIVTTLQLLLTVLAVNLLLLPVYLALIFVPPLNLALFYLVNGWLLGREYFETVALRRLEPREARTLRRRNRSQVWLTGAVIAALFSIPFVNLTAPVIGTALMLHRFRRLQDRADQPTAGNGRGRAVLATMLLAALIIAAARFETASLPGGPVGAGAQAARIIGPEMPPDPGELLGLGQIDVRNRLGAPELVRREGPARVWQYTSDTCVLDLYLYAEADDFKVIYVKTRGRRADREAGIWCYAAIIANGRDALPEPVSARR